MEEQGPVCSPDGPSQAEDAEAARQAESKRLAEIDKPLEDDPIGNGIIGALGGGVAGLIRGGATGVASMALKGSGLVGKTLKYLWDSNKGGPADGGGGTEGARGY